MPPSCGGFQRRRKDGGGKAALTVKLAAVPGHLDWNEDSFHGPDDFFVAMRRVAIVQEIRLDVPMTIKDDVTELEEEGLPLDHVGGCAELHIESVFEAFAQCTIDGNAKSFVILRMDDWILDGGPALALEELSIEGGLVSVDDGLAGRDDVRKNEGEGSSFIGNLSLFGDSLSIHGLPSAESDTIRQVKAPESIGAYCKLEWLLL